jgi:hypothetical protein
MFVEFWDRTPLVGGGFFFVLPGVTSGDGWLGQQLLA